MLCAKDKDARTGPRPFGNGFVFFAQARPEEAKNAVFLGVFEFYKWVRLVIIIFCAESLPVPRFGTIQHNCA
jgi:hypothetical protein